MTKEYYVYAWYFISNQEIFYIGKGKGNRFSDITHSRNDYFKSIISKHADNVSVKKLFEGLSNEDACSIEKNLIAYYRSIGQCKANFHEGGHGGNTGNYDNAERSRKLSEAAKKRVGKNNPHYGRTLSEEQKQAMSSKIKALWENPETRPMMMKNRENVGFKKGNIPWNTNKTYSLGKMSEEHYVKMMLSDCPYKYEVYFHDELIYWTISSTKLENFCKETFNISRTIVYKILDGVWAPTFNKHKHLESLKIIRLDRSVSTNRDECSGVEWRLLPLEVHGNQEDG